MYRKNDVQLQKENVTTSLEKQLIAGNVHDSPNFHQLYEKLSLSMQVLKLRAC